jgi:hypothetical protein
MSKLSNTFIYLDECSLLDHPCASIADALNYCMQNTAEFENGQNILIANWNTKECRWYKAQLTMEIVDND